jgi:hypothetical protein
MQNVDMVEEGAPLALRDALLGSAVQAPSAAQTAATRAEESDL